MTQTNQNCPIESMLVLKWRSHRRSRNTADSDNHISIWQDGKVVTLSADEILPLEKDIISNPVD
jgi:hypothetical protein